MKKLVHFQLKPILINEWMSSWVKFKICVTNKHFIKVNMTRSLTD